MKDPGPSPDQFAQVAAMLPKFNPNPEIEAIVTCPDRTLEIKSIPRPVPNLSMYEEAVHEAISPPLICPVCGWIADCHFEGKKVWRPPEFFAVFHPRFEFENTSKFPKEKCDWCK